MGSRLHVIRSILAIAAFFEEFLKLLNNSAITFSVDNGFVAFDDFHIVEIHTWHSQAFKIVFGGHLA